MLRSVAFSERGDRRRQELDRRGIHQHKGQHTVGRDLRRMLLFQFLHRLEPQRRSGVAKSKEICADIHRDVAESLRLGVHIGIQPPEDRRA